MKEAEIKKMIANNEKLEAENKKLQETIAAQAEVDEKKKEQPKPVLTEETAKDFELVDWVGSHRQSFGKFGVVDLSTLDPKRADRLVKRGFKKIKRKK